MYVYVCVNAILLVRSKGISYVILICMVVVKCKAVSLTIYLNHIDYEKTYFELFIIVGLVCCFVIGVLLKINKE